MDNVNGDMTIAAMTDFTGNGLDRCLSTTMLANCSLT